MAGGAVPVPRTWRWDGDRWVEIAPEDAGAVVADVDGAHPGGVGHWQWDGERWQPRSGHRRADRG